MRILLLHEMSGLHTNLKEGLVRLGHNVDLATYGDGWKRYSSDVDIGSTGSGLGAHFDRARKNIGLSFSFDEYDVIQVISPTPFYRPLNSFLTARLLRSRARKVYVAAGSDAIYRQHVRELKYFPPHDWFENGVAYDRLVRMLKSFDAIVPVCWEYHFCMKRAGLQVFDVLPLPVNLDHFIPRQNSGPIQIFHPVNRGNLDFDFKGTKLISSAFDYLKNRYADTVNFIAKGGMPHSEYANVSASADIVVDQLYSYSYGMSATIAMAQGKVVLSGLEAVAKNEFEFYGRSPVINVEPSFESVIDRLTPLLESADSVRAQGGRFSAFAREVHDAGKVAEHYSSLYRAI